MSEANTSLDKNSADLNSMLMAGTGHMLNLSDSIREMEKRGYTENLSLHFDHFSAHSGLVELYPDDFCIDEIIRFENSSDPDDQSILYAISSEKKGVKGLHASYYGVGSEEMAPVLIEKIRACHKRGH